MKRLPNAIETPQTIKAIIDEGQENIGTDEKKKYYQRL
jgi:hypothetical protein